MPREDEVFVDNAWRRAAANRRLTVINPATERPCGVAVDGNATDIDTAVRAARRALCTSGWATSTAAQRAATMTRLADAITARAVGFSQLLTTQTGSPVSETRGAAANAAATLRYFAGLAGEVAREEVRIPAGGETHTVVRRQPMGVVGVITPWNFPLTLITYKLAPALATGCAVVVKPAPQTPLDVRLLAECVLEAGIPAGLVNIVTGGPEAGEALVRHPLVDKIAFTGSSAAGREVGRRCGHLLRPVTLELGGKSAAVLLADFDPEAYRRTMLRVTLRNTGQTCYAATRILAPRSRYEEVVELTVQVVTSAHQGDPFAPDTVFGPVISARQRERVEKHIRTGEAEGAKLACGGRRPPALDVGYYVEPAVFRDVTPSMTIARTEIFGPVLSILAYDSDEDAVRIANDSEFGLGGTVYSRDEEHALAIAERIETGSVGINFFANNPAAPFSGWKNSGLGTELGIEGMAAYLKPQSIHLPRAHQP